MSAIDEAVKKTIRPARAQVAQQAALMRLQLYLTGATHQVLGSFVGKIRDSLTEFANDDGQLSGLGLAQVLGVIEAEWPKTFAAWGQLFEMARREAASLPFGALTIQHNAFVTPVFEERRRGSRETFDEAEARQSSFDDVFRPRLAVLMDAAAARVLPDGMVLSARVWNLGQESLSGIRSVLYSGAADGRSAWDIAKDLEGYLGTNQRCPRWTADRLYRLTKKDIASGDRTGLLTGDDCDGRGVSYKALRLARNELQVVHHMASDALAADIPWIEEEKIELSPDHPKPDICDDVARGGEHGDGVYPKGEITLPLHVQCSPPGQAVITPDGVKPIEEVMAGDEVLTHRGRYRRVIATITRPYSGDLAWLRTEHGSELLLTPEHPVLSGGRWVGAGRVVMGEAVWAIRPAVGRRALGWLTHIPAERVTLSQAVPYQGDVYNLTVEEDESYVLNGIVTHNCLCFKTTILPDADEFAASLREWIQGGENPAMDTYAAAIGGRERVGEPMGGSIAGALVAWLWDSAEELAARLDRAG